MLKWESRKAPKSTIWSNPSISGALKQAGAAVAVLLSLAGGGSVTLSVAAAAAWNSWLLLLRPGVCQFLLFICAEVVFGAGK